MSFHIADNTAGSQRFAVDNSGNTELGTATPSSKLSVNGHSVLSGTMLAQSTAAPASMPRITGSLSFTNTTAATPVTLNIPATSSGMGSIDGAGTLVAYNAAKSQITVAGQSSSGTVTLNYGTF
jgi:hypothetical protein